MQKNFQVACSRCGKKPIDANCTPDRRSVGGNSCSGRGFASCHVTTCNEIVAELRQADRPLGAESNGVRRRIGVGVRVQKSRPGLGAMPNPMQESIRCSDQHRSATGKVGQVDIRSADKAVADRPVIRVADRPVMRDAKAIEGTRLTNRHWLIDVCRPPYCGSVHPEISSSCLDHGRAQRHDGHDCERSHCAVPYRLQRRRGGPRCGPQFYGGAATETGVLSTLTAPVPLTKFFNV